MTNPILYYFTNGFKIPNIGPNGLNLTPNDSKFDADSKNGIRMPRKTIFGREVQKTKPVIMVFTRKAKN